MISDLPLIFQQYVFFQDDIFLFSSEYHICFEVYSLNFYEYILFSFIGILLFWFWYTIDHPIIILIVTFEYVEFWRISQQWYDFSQISQCNTFS